MISISDKSKTFFEFINKKTNQNFIEEKRINKKQTVVLKVETLVG